MPLALIIVAAVLIGMGTGWGVKGWKDGARIAQITADRDGVKSDNAILAAANSNCAVDIESIKKGVAVVVSQVEDRERAASAAMKAADLAIAKRKAAERIKRLPVIAPAPEAQCAAMIKEQIDYVQERH